VAVELVPLDGDRDLVNLKLEFDTHLERGIISVPGVLVLWDNGRDAKPQGSHKVR